jgi:aspartyl-tRNA(Asn)/glutamyl-tRNA(Gln) amidotransferase subunit B
MEKGMMRFDASVSIRPNGDNKLYPRAEIKNLNSFKSLEAGIDYEIERQIFMWEGGKPQERDITVGWSDDHQKTYFLRDKEGADDYRYFPEPDLPMLSMDINFIEELRRSIPEMPAEKFGRYVNDLKVSEAEALLLSDDPDLSSYFDTVCKLSSDAKKSATFVTSILLSYLKRDGISIKDVKVGPEILAGLVILINADKVSMNIAKSVVFEEMYLTGKPAETIILEKGLVVNNNSGEIEELCKSVLAANVKSVEDFKGGKTNAFGFLVGQAMKQSKGQANAKMVNEIIEKLLKTN